SPEIAPRKLPVLTRESLFKSPATRCLLPLESVGTSLNFGTGGGADFALISSSHLFISSSPSLVASASAWIEEPYLALKSESDMIAASLVAVAKPLIIPQVEES